MKRVHTGKMAFQGVIKKSSLVKIARKRLLISVESVKPTPEAQERAFELVSRARKAKEARFLDKYRNHLAA